MSIHKVYFYELFVDNYVLIVYSIIIGGVIMFSYKPLLKTMIEKDINKTQLREILNCSKNTIAKISKNEYVSMEILDKICDLLDCNISDVIEHINLK